mmetsp:Transcript_27151/g.63117  ORF Transcript_27151/g.63117 Transcript_27151/m.63117 type:complete len:391 (-) Transcript_27151:94-1266(-)
MSEEGHEDIPAETADQVGAATEPQALVSATDEAAEEPTVESTQAAGIAEAGLAEAGDDRPATEPSSAHVASEQLEATIASVAGEVAAGLGSDAEQQGILQATAAQTVSPGSEVAVPAGTASAPPVEHAQAKTIQVVVGDDEEVDEFGRRRKRKAAAKGQDKAKAAKDALERLYGRKRVREVEPGEEEAKSEAAAPSEAGLDTFAEAKPMMMFPQVPRWVPPKKPPSISQANMLPHVAPRPVQAGMANGWSPMQAAGKGAMGLTGSGAGIAMQGPFAAQGVRPTPGFRPSPITVPMSAAVGAGGGCASARGAGAAGGGSDWWEFSSAGCGGGAAAWTDGWSDHGAKGCSGWNGKGYTEKGCGGWSNPSAGCIGWGKGIDTQWHQWGGKGEH